MKQSGVLMPVSALPSHYLVGDFGPEAYRFAKMIKDAGYDYWQMLPLNTLGFGNSPYQCFSSKAIDPIYVSIDLLRKEGLIRKKYPHTVTDRVDYSKARKLKEEALREAFGRFEVTDEFNDFVKQKWVTNYAIFMAFKQKNGGQCWNLWPKEYKNFPLKRDKKLLESNSEVIKYHQFVQYILFKQLFRLKNYVSEIGLKIIGDIPFYVGIDSDDVYFNRECFELNKDGKPEWIAGVPPDFFNDLGQRWGNPLYRWDYLKEHDYSIWFERLSFNSKIFDVLRLDHFRAFDTYWKVRETEETAVNGEWVENYGVDFFTRLFKKYPDMNIIVEDLGDLRPQVHQLRDRFDLLGMRILQYTFFHEDKEAELCYIGTHDNDSVTGWLKSQSAQFRMEVRKKVKTRFSDKNLYDAVMKYSLSLKSRLIILSVNDITLDDRKINSPGTIGSPNWEYKLSSFRSLSRRLKLIRGERH